MGRRSDHSRAELKELLLLEGHRQMAEVGFARFSARDLAKRVGYSVGTIYNVFPSLDALFLEINTRTFDLWADALRRKLEGVGGAHRIEALVKGYFEFARANRHLWTAIYDHHLPDGAEMPFELAERRGALTQIVTTEVERALPEAAEVDTQRLARSLIATVHGHCAFALSGTFALMGETDPEEVALTRVRQSLVPEAPNS